MKQVNLYVNGHTLDTNPGPAGSGIVLSYEGITKEMYIPLGHTTNNQAELAGAIQGLESLKQPCEVTVYSCSQWFIRCAEGAWERGKYLNMWQALDDACLTHEVTFQWIRKGSHEFLDRASALANEGANESAVDLAS
jgi:ribonuclease HI